MLRKSIFAAAAMVMSSAGVARAATPYGSDGAFATAGAVRDDALAVAPRVGDHDHVRVVGRPDADGEIPVLQQLQGNVDALIVTVLASGGSASKARTASVPTRTVPDTG